MTHIDNLSKTSTVVHKLSRSDPATAHITTTRAYFMTVCSTCYVETVFYLQIRGFKYGALLSERDLFYKLLG